MCTNRNDEYFVRCDNLYYLILKAYTDKFLLEAIELCNKNIEKSCVIFTDILVFLLLIPYFGIIMYKTKFV